MFEILGKNFKKNSKDIKGKTDIFSKIMQNEP